MSEKSLQKTNRGSLVNILDYRIKMNELGHLKMLRDYIKEYQEVKQNGYIKVSDAQDVFEYMQGHGIKLESRITQVGNLEYWLGFYNKDWKLIKRYMLISYQGCYNPDDFVYPSVHFYYNILSGDQYIGFIKQISADKESVEYFSLTTLKWESFDIDEGLADDGVYVQMNHGRANEG